MSRVVWAFIVALALIAAIICIGLAWEWVTRVLYGGG